MGGESLPSILPYFPQGVMTQLNLGTRNFSNIELVRERLKICDLRELRFASLIGIGVLFALVVAIL